ncbi:MAG: acetylornithine/succinylornithine family transaminase [Longimicrobiales bacterium]
MTTQVATQNSLLGVYRPAAPVFVSGSGRHLVARDGRTYLDFTSGIGVNALGYADAGIAAAMQTAIETGVVHTSNLFRTEPCVDLAGLLTSHSFAQRVFFCNSGAEANEAAFKFARKYARSSAEAGGEAEKHEIVALRGAFHGRLFGALAATDRPSMQQPFEPLMPGVQFITPGDVAEAAAVISAAKTAAVIVEPIQGEGGIQPLSAEYVAKLRELTDAAGALLIFDEVQCGLGRTGRLFAYEWLGVVPDMVTLAKPLAGGLPMGAVLMTEAVASVMVPGDHATTFGGGPFVSAVALEVVSRISDPSFLAEVRARGHQLETGLREIASKRAIKEVRGVGLMWGMELDQPAAPVVAAAMENGLLVISAGERVLRLLPALNIEPGEIAEGLSILEEVLS